jgi:hypothetical protein
MWWSRRTLIASSLFGSYFHALNETTNRQLVNEFVSRLSSKDYDGMVDIFTLPNATYWLNGSPSLTNCYAGNQTFASGIATYSSSLGSFDNFTFTITNSAPTG